MMGTALSLLLLSADPAVDPLALGGVLVADGHFDRALKTLEPLSPDEEDQGRYWTLLGLAHQGLGEHSKAIRFFRQARGAENAEPSIALYEAQSLLHQDKSQAAEQLLKTHQKQLAHLPASFILLSESQTRQDKHTRGWQTLEKGLQHHPNHRLLLRQRLTFLARQRLYQTVLKTLPDVQKHLDWDDWRAVAGVAFEHGDVTTAQRILEMARLNYPYRGDIVSSLAHTYAVQEQYLTAATILETKIPQDQAEDLAELYKRASQPRLAEYWQAAIIKPKAKTRKRLALFIEQNRFEEAALLESRLRRDKLLSEDDVRYALAYAMFRTQRFPQALKHLKRVSNPALLNQVSTLRDAITQCTQTPETCL